MTAEPVHAMHTEVVGWALELQQALRDSPGAPIKWLGYHCPVCGEPCSSMGHSACQGHEAA